MPNIALDPLQQAAECERILRSTTDQRQRELLSYLHGMWLSLARESRFLTRDELVAEIETVRQIQTDFEGELARSAGRLAH